MKRAAQSGFTLMEVLLALVLLAMLMGGAFAAMRASTRAVESGEKLIDRTNKIRVAQEFIRREISQSMALAVDTDTSTGEIRLLEGDGEQITFVAPMPGYLGRGGAYVQRLTFEDTEGGLSLVFRHAMHNGYKPEDRPLEDPDVEPVVLLENIRDASFEYRSLDDQGKLGDWEEEWDEKSRLPLLVRVNIEFVPEAQMLWPELVIPLMLESTPTFRDPFSVGML